MPTETENTPYELLLAAHTTSRVGGSAQALITATTEQDIIEAFHAADEHDDAVLLLGGGSNLLVSDEGFPGTVIRVATEGVEILDDDQQHTLIRVAAGHVWDETVAWSVDQGLSGLEALSGVPGLTGATPVQNVGAYGADVSETLISIRAWDRQKSEVVVLSNAELVFGYRDSIIKRTIADSTTNPRAATPRWVVLSVDFRLNKTGEQAPVKYSQLARTLHLNIGDTAPLHEVRDRVLKLRASKGMVLDVEDHDTWSTGSFFTNPIIPADDKALGLLPADAPQFEAGVAQDGTRLVKLSAAWLIDRAGYHKGFGSDLVEGRASLSTKHTLALTNRGEATTEDMLTVARTVRDGVAEKWGITLHPEPVLLGCSL